MSEKEDPIDTSKFGQLVADAKAELRLHPTGKFPAEILRMAREARNQSSAAERLRRFPQKPKAT